MILSWGLGGTVLTTLLLLSRTTSETSDNIDLFWNLYRAVMTGSRILRDIQEGVGAVSKAIRSIDSFLDGAEEEEEGTATGAASSAATGAASSAASEAAALKDPKTANGAPPGTESAVQSNVPTVFNGCGALGFHIRDANLPLQKMTDCCSSHDRCYEASCKVNKRDCDSNLRSCLFSVCNNNNNNNNNVAAAKDKSNRDYCNSAAKLLFSGTMALSFQQYHDAQSRNSCTLQGKEKEKPSSNSGPKKDLKK